MPKTRVRQAASADFPTLLNIDKASFPPGIAYDSAELSYFMRREGAETLVAEENGEIVGFLLVDILARRRTATLVTLDVCEAHRRNGFATELFTVSEKILRDREIKRYELQVDVSNSVAIDFYKKHGFEIVRQLQRYYSNGHNAYLMAKTL